MLERIESNKPQLEEGPQLFSIPATKDSPLMRMPSTLVLSVGVDSSLLGTRNVVLQSVGYIVVSALSIKEAVNNFRNGDFDLVLLDNSLPKKDKDRLTCLIRASGSRTPVVTIASERGDEDSFADATVESDPSKLLTGIRDTLVKAAKAPVTWTAILRDDQGVAAAPGKQPAISSGKHDYEQ